MREEIIVKNLTLDQYNKKFKNCKNRICKFTKEDIESFDKKYGFYKFNEKTHQLDHQHYLLKNRKWLLIGDTYYEIPKPPRLSWFRNLSIGIQIATCAVTCAGVTSAVVFPSLAKTVWKKVDPTPTPTPVDPDWMSKSNWYDLTDSATESDIGKTVKININGLDHEVVLIDIDKDTDENGNKIHTTWEFKNLICDERGYSLAYQYRDCINVIKTEKPELYSKWIGKTLDYNNSSINYALTGHGTNGFKNVEKSEDPESDYKKYYKDYVEGKETEILVARCPVTDEEKTATDFNWFKNTEEYKTKYNIKYNYAIPVIDMIPKEITAKFKPVSKVNNEKLFLLSAKEIDGGYSYYKYKGLKSRIRRIKKQIYQTNPETGEQYENNKAVSIALNAGQLYTNSGIAAQAGRNDKIAIAGSEIYGGYYWCRDVGAVSSTGYQYLNRIAPKGIIGPGCPITDAYAIAPAFCI